MTPAERVDLLTLALRTAETNIVRTLRDDDAVNIRSKSRLHRETKRAA